MKLNFWPFNRKPKIAVPPDKWFEQALAKTQFTPDAASLSRKPYHRLFVMDELMKPHAGHHLLHGPSKKYVAFTQDNFSVWRSTEGRESRVVPLERLFYGLDHTMIRGELWAVSFQTILFLDKHKENGVQFERKRVKLVIPYTLKSVLVPGEVRESTIQPGRLYQETPYIKDVTLTGADWTKTAWMYVGKPAYWDNLFTGSRVKLHVRAKDGEKHHARLIGRKFWTPVRTFEPLNPNLKKYYYHTAYEYNKD